MSIFELFITDFFWGGGGGEPSIRTQWKQWGIKMEYFGEKTKA